MSSIPQFVQKSSPVDIINRRSCFFSEAAAWGGGEAREAAEALAAEALAGGRAAWAV